MYYIERVYRKEKHFKKFLHDTFQTFFWLEKTMLYYQVKCGRDFSFKYLKTKVSQILLGWLKTLNKNSLYIMYKLDNNIGATPPSGPLQVIDEYIEVM